MMDRPVDETLIIAALVARLGGEVWLTAEELVTVVHADIETIPDLMGNRVGIRTRGAGAVLVGEVVPDDGREIRPIYALTDVQDKRT